VFFCQKGSRADLLSEGGTTERQGGSSLAKKNLLRGEAMILTAKNRARRILKKEEKDSILVPGVIPTGRKKRGKLRPGEGGMPQTLGNEKTITPPLEERGEDKSWV